MLLTTNPGYLDSNTYAGDPNNNPVPDEIHNDYLRGIISYALANLSAGAPPFSQDVAGIVNGPTAADIAASRILDANNAWIDPPAVFAQDVAGYVPGPTAADIAASRLIDANGAWVDPPAVFAQDVAGYVPGPTAADIAANRLIDANGAWVDPPSGGLVTSGTGTINPSGGGANIGGRFDPGTTTTVSGDGSLFTGYNPVGTITISGQGNLVAGLNVNSLGTIAGNGNLLAGYFGGGTVTNNANDNGNFMCANISSGTFTFNQDGGAVLGNFNGGVNEAGRGSQIFGDGADFLATGIGATCRGMNQNGGSSSATNQGSFASGKAEGVGAQNDATGEGAHTFVRVTAGNQALASGIGSGVLGHIDGGDGIASANGAWQVGPGTNATVDSFQIGSVAMFDHGADEIGLFGAAPVVQQNGTGETVGFTAGAGTGVNDDSTFTGNVGATAYRISDIVKALKNYGLLAQ